MIIEEFTRVFYFIRKNLPAFSTLSARIYPHFLPLSARIYPHPLIRTRVFYHTVLNYHLSGRTRLIRWGWQQTIQKKAIAKIQSRNIFHRMEIYLYVAPKRLWVYVFLFFSQWDILSIRSILIIRWKLKSLFSGEWRSIHDVDNIYKGCFSFPKPYVSTSKRDIYLSNLIMLKCTKYQFSLKGKRNVEARQ